MFNPMNDRKKFVSVREMVRNFLGVSGSLPEVKPLVALGDTINQHYKTQGFGSQNDEVVLLKEITLLRQENERLREGKNERKFIKTF